ncbi:hypothetical protein [Chachezhania sediminis]|uniref:hypothetical protein n=1 Tax=Chachezhania sediminis TaxID=2599291 RepID=UPI0038991493
MAPPPKAFRKGRDFVAWRGLTRRQRATGGKHAPAAPSCLPSTISPPCRFQPCRAGHHAMRSMSWAKRSAKAAMKSRRS